MLLLLRAKNQVAKTIALACLILYISDSLHAQRVENRGCPDSYFRNNGNGQSVTVFASNINPTSVYFQNALTSGNQGNFTFKWGTNIVNPPVISRTWVTTSSGVTTQNWVFGNNTTGSPFNPPGVPVLGDVKYTFYNSNLPTAGVVTLELIDPFDSSYVNTCSYPLTSGSSSIGTIVSLAVAAPSNLNYSVNSATVLFGNAGNSVAPTVNAAGGTITYSMTPQVNGISIDPSSGVISWNGTVASGIHNLSVKASNGIQPDATTDYTLTVTETGVGSGNAGGLESKSLGNAVAERVFNNSVQSVPAEMNYHALPELTNNSTARLSSLSIRDFMPDQRVLGNGFTGYITSPTDILSFTNAADVVSVDYVEAGLNKAVAFCTKTYNGVYTHTKPVCDRLKGAELLSVDTISLGQHKFLRYHLKPANGLNEYAISFSAGFNQNDNRYTLQSEWMTDNYAAQDTMYNFQLWSADLSLMNTMLNNVLQKLNNDMPLNQLGQVKKPVTYITKATRDDQNQLNLKLTIRNNSSATNGTMIISGNANEQSTNTITQTYPVSFLANAISTITIPVKDMAEAEIRLKINGITEDFIYSNDGIWNIYKTTFTQVSEYTISNDTVQPKANEYRLFRNVKLKATTSDYITVYRMVKGGGVAADLSSFQYLKFNASGTGNVRIRLMKKSITNFSEQYEYLLPLSDIDKEYVINTEAFKSSGSAERIKLTDIVIVSFTYEATSSSTPINASLRNVRFAGKTIGSAITGNKLLLYPNPARGQLNLAFESTVAEPMNIELINMANGQVAYKKQITAVSGNNTINLGLPPSLAAGIYVVRVQSATQKLISKMQIQ